MVMMGEMVISVLTFWNAIYVFISSISKPQVMHVHMLVAELAVQNY
jgi:hypothetical protein